MRDAAITTEAYDEAYVDLNNYSVGAAYSIGLQGGFAINSNLEVNGRFGIGGFTPLDSSGTSGLTDLVVSGRYLVYKERDVYITAGGGVSLPVGEEKAGYGNFAIGGFGALRYTLNERLLLTSTLGLDVVETGVVSDNSTTSMSFSGGLVYLFNNRLAIVGEFQFRTNIDYSLLSAGVDYQLAVTRIRGALGVGFNDGAPNVRFQAGYIFSF